MRPVCKRGEARVSFRVLADPADGDEADPNRNRLVVRDADDALMGVFEPCGSDTCFVKIFDGRTLFVPFSRIGLGRQNSSPPSVVGFASNDCSGNPNGVLSNL